MYWVVLVIHVLLGLGLIFLVLLHSGKGGGLSDMFGGGLGATSAGCTARIQSATILPRGDSWAYERSTTLVSTTPSGRSRTSLARSWCSVPLSIRWYSCIPDPHPAALVNTASTSSGKALRF